MSDDRIWILLTKKDAGDITSEELKELERLLQGDDSVRIANGFVQEILQKDISVAGQSIDTAVSWESVRRKLDESAPPRQLNMRVVFRRLAVAASLAILVVCGILIFATQREQDGAEEDSNQVSTLLGSRSQVVLPDGTKVWLNSGSKLTYKDFRHAAQREVTLSGEAFFRVVHDDAHPFIVHTKTIDIRDIGTEFVVKAYPKDNSFEATLIEGAIEVIDQRDTERKILLKPKEKIIIPLTDSLQTLSRPAATGSESTMLYKVDKVAENDHGLIPETAWVHNKLVFNNETFGELAERIERWYNVKIYFEDTLIEETPFSGIIENETLEQALKAMQFSASFTYRLQGNKVWIKK